MKSLFLPGTRVLVCEPHAVSTALMYFGTRGLETSKILMPSHDCLSVVGELVDEHESSLREESVDS